MSDQPTLDNIYDSHIAARGFVPLAIEAGIETVIRSVTPLARDETSLLLALKTALWESNRPLADALSIPTLRAIMKHLAARENASVMLADDLPTLLDQDGPATVNAARDGSVPTQVNVSYIAPPTETIDAEEVAWTGEIYVAGNFAKHSTVAAVDGWCHDLVQHVGPGAVTIRVCYRSPRGEITQFGPIVEILA
ncbi:MAG: hypothetical protein ACLFTK_09340 [Anaerolineales bacterium]